MVTVIQDIYGRGLTKSLRNVLERQTINAERPGPILADTESLIGAIGEGMATTSKHFALPQSDLNDLNIRMAEPLSHRLKRPQLRSFPTLMGLYALMRASGLAVGEAKPKRVVLIDPEMLGQWNTLNATERYMSLLQTWWTTASWDSIGKTWN